MNANCLLLNLKKKNINKHNFALCQTKHMFTVHNAINTVRIKIIFPHHFNDDLTAWNTKWFQWLQRALRTQILQHQWSQPIDIHYNNLSENKKGNAKDERSSRMWVLRELNIHIMNSCSFHNLNILGKYHCS